MKQTKKETKKAKSVARILEFCTARDLAIRDLLEMGAESHPAPSSRSFKFGNALTLSQMIETLPLERQQDLPDTVVHAIALRNLVFTDNFGLLLKFAYQNRGNHLEKEEAIQAASFGFMRAIEIFDPARGNQLSTVAALWVRHYCQKWMRLTGHTQPKAYLLAMHAMERHYAKTGRRITAEEMGISQTRLDSILTQRSFLRLGIANKGRACGGLPRLLALQGNRRRLATHTNESNEDVGEIQDILRTPRPNPEELLANRQSDSIIEKAISECTGLAREVMGALYSEGLSVLDTAHRLKIRPTQVREIRDEIIGEIRDRLNAEDIETP